MRARELDLLRRWSVRPDPDGRGLAEEWWRTPPAEGWLACRADEAWQLVLGTDYHGVAWYWRRARLPRRWVEGGGRVWLRFGPVATDCRVWINGVEIGGHAGDYVPFDLDISKALAGEERCEILCRVDEIKGSAPEVIGKDPWIGHITKGFHDVLGMQHGGLWGGVAARQTGPIAIRPNGVAAIADPGSGVVLVRVELHPHEASGRLEVTLTEPGTERQHRASAAISPGQLEAEVQIACEERRLWSPDSPDLGTVAAVVRSDSAPGRDAETVRFAFRRFEVGGRDGRRILLNGSPLLVRGMLDWGVEPEHIAPAPTRDELLGRFHELRARGFNCVCLCMVYPPEHFYDVADETDMLLWQIHPVWKSDMSAGHIPEYKRLFAEFFRRDRRHPSVFLVSATCEHERFDVPLGEWWWDRGRAELPHNLLQVQTGFLRWSDTERMDLWDEHTYDNSGRWLCYMDDLGRFFEGRPARPFVMGETIIGASWPDTKGMLEELGDDRPWWGPKSLDAFIAFERRLAQRFGERAVVRLRAQGDVFNLGQRKLQSEVLRARPHNAGWVMNHLRDVPSCQCGFQDHLDRWRFGPEQLLPFLGDRAILLRTPAYAVGFELGRRVSAEIGISNFGAAAWSGPVAIFVAGPEGDAPGRTPRVSLDLEAAPGEVSFARFDLPALGGDVPARIDVRAEAGGVEHNQWRLWGFPPAPATPSGVFRDAVSPFTASELAPDFEERRYSSGWALECTSWGPRLPDVAALLPETPAWRNGELPPRVDHLTIVTPRLTEHMLLHLEHGGRVVLLASKAAGSPPTKWINLYGQIPLIVESGDGGRESVLRAGESAWVLDTLGLDLNRWSCRAVPVHELGLVDSVDPVIRLVVTHDKGAPEPWDQLFLARVGAGVLAVSTLDHGNPAGRHLLRRTIDFVHRPDSPGLVRAELPVDTVRVWCCRG